MREIKLEGITNARDLGGIPVADGCVVKRGLMYRGDALWKLSDAAKTRLRHEYGIRCVIDLRCGWEREAKPDVAIAGIESLFIPFYDLEVAGVEYTRSIEGSKVTGHDVVCDPDHFYRDMPNPLTAKMMARALDEIFARALDEQPVYFHCSGGKDRAGIMALLVLKILGASDEEILEDYLLTNMGRDKNIESIFERFLRLMDGDAKRAWEVTDNHRACPENLAAFYESVDERYGNMDVFLGDVLGYGPERCKQLRAALTAPLGE